MLLLFNMVHFRDVAMGTCVGFGAQSRSRSVGYSFLCVVLASGQPSRLREWRNQMERKSQRLSALNNSKLLAIRHSHLHTDPIAFALKND